MIHSEGSIFMNKISVVIIDADGSASNVDVGTSIKELSEAIGAPEADCVCWTGGICAFVDYDYCTYAPQEDYNAVASAIMTESSGEVYEVYGSVLFAANGSDDEEPGSLTNEQVIELLNKAEKYMNRMEEIE